MASDFADPLRHNSGFCTQCRREWALRSPDLFRMDTPKPSKNPQLSITFYHCTTVLPYSIWQENRPSGWSKWPQVEGHSARRQSASVDQVTWIIHEGGCLFIEYHNCQKVVPFGESWNTYGISDFFITWQFRLAVGWITRQYSSLFC
jgi:hypothetical protein